MVHFQKVSRGRPVEFKAQNVVRQKKTIAEC